MAETREEYRRRWNAWARTPAGLASRKRSSSKKNAAIKAEVYARYGGKCVRCGFTDTRALQMDHVNGDGAEDRRRFPGSNVYRHVLKQGCPDTYQLLCANCNWIKRSEQGEVNWAGRPRTAA